MDINQQPYIVRSFAAAVFLIANGYRPTRIVGNIDSPIFTFSGDAREADCDKFFALYADIDFKNVPREECDKILGEMPVPPDVIVMSGGGYHTYWLLAEPVDARAAYTLLTRLQTYVKSDKVSD